MTTLPDNMVALSLVDKRNKLLLMLSTDAIDGGIAKMARSPQLGMLLLSLLM